MEIRKCQHCGKGFVSKLNKKYCCVECKKLHIRQKQKEKRAAEKEQIAAVKKAFKKSMEKPKKKAVIANTAKYGNNISDYEIKQIYDKHISKRKAYEELAKMGVKAEQVRQAKNERVFDIFK